MDYGLWIMDYGLWIMDYGLWIMDYGLWIMDYGLWIMDIIRKKMKNLITNAYILSKEDFLLGAFFLSSIYACSLEPVPI